MSVWYSDSFAVGTQCKGSTTKLLQIPGCGCKESKEQVLKISSEPSTCDSLHQELVGTDRKGLGQTWTERCHCQATHGNQNVKGLQLLLTPKRPPRDPIVSYLLGLSTVQNWATSESATHSSPLQWAKAIKIVPVCVHDIQKMYMYRMSYWCYILAIVGACVCPSHIKSLST